MHRNASTRLLQRIVPTLYIPWTTKQFYIGLIRLDHSWYAMNSSRVARAAV
ncbi:MAG: hypothetical protein ACTSYB_10180 [Candidatus Helarchaeota archaeon]